MYTIIQKKVWAEFLYCDKHLNIDLCVHLYFRIDEVVPRQVKVKKSSDEVCDLLLKGGICFNCEGNHTLRECTKPRNNENIMRNRKKMQALM